MEFRDKIQMLKDKIREKFRIFVISFELYKSPMHLLNLIIAVVTIVVGIIGGLYAYFENPTIKFYLIIFIVIIFFIFFYLLIDNIIYLMFPSTRWAKIIVDTYDNNPEIISYISKNIEIWLENITDFIKKQPNMINIIEYVKKDEIEKLEELSKKFLDSSSTNKLIEKKGNYLNALIVEASNSFQIPQSSLEDFIDTKIDVNQKIGIGIISSYNQIQNSIQQFIKASEDCRNATDYDSKESYGKIRKYHSEKIVDTGNDILRKGKCLENQIEWLKELDKRKWAIPKLIEIINESSTGNALAKLSKLLKHVYLFSWDNVPGNDNGRLVEFLNQNFGIEWVKTAKIRKIDGGRTIKVSTEKNFILMSLNDEKTKINLEIDDGRTDKFIAKMENSKLNLYKQAENPEDLWWLIQFAESRKGYRIGELLGLKVVKNNSSNRVLEWYGAPIPQKFVKEQKFFEEFDMLRGEALSRLWGFGTKFP